MRTKTGVMLCGHGSRDGGRQHLVGRRLEWQHVERQHVVGQHLEREHVVREHLVRQHVVRQLLVRQHVERQHMVRGSLAGRDLGLSPAARPRALIPTPTAADGAH